MQYPPSFYPQQMEGGTSRVGEPETGLGYDPTPLPHGWIATMDKKSGRVYFQNNITRTTTWDDPRVSGEYKAVPPGTNASPANANYYPQQMQMPMPPMGMYQQQPAGMYQQQLMPVSPVRVVVIQQPVAMPNLYAHVAVLVVSLVSFVLALVALSTNYWGVRSIPDSTTNGYTSPGYSTYGGLWKICYSGSGNEFCISIDSQCSSAGLVILPSCGLVNAVRAFVVLHVVAAFAISAVLVARFVVNANPVRTQTVIAVMGPLAWGSAAMGLVAVILTIVYGEGERASAGASYGFSFALETVALILSMGAAGGLLKISATVGAGDRV